MIGTSNLVATGDIAGGKINPDRNVSHETTSLLSFANRICHKKLESISARIPVTTYKHFRMVPPLKPPFTPRLDISNQYTTFG
jgi:hypothetical protein